MIDALDRSLFNEDHHAFRDTVRKVLDTVIAPRMDAHEHDGVVEREAWAKVGTAGLLCPQVPEAYGGPGLDFAFNAIVGEELSYMGSAAGFTVQFQDEVGVTGGLRISEGLEQRRVILREDVGDAPGVPEDFGVGRCS